MYLKPTEDYVRYQKIEVYSTKILKFDCSNLLSEDEIKLMISDVEEICNIDNCMQLDNFTPKFQCKPILFSFNSPEHWQKLKQIFLQCCKNYLEIVENFTKNQDALEFTHSRAWFYKGWKSLNQTQNNPWHNHNPAFLSGVFYLKLPEENEHSGTEFGDPRIPEAYGNRNQIISGSKYSWTIFPSWMNHRSGYCDTEESRITVAADSYIMVL